MRQTWRKIGWIFNADQSSDWLHSHASVPLAEHLSEDLYRIYFSSRDSKNQSHTGFIVIDIKDPTKVLETSALPILSPGDLGCFDDSGAMASWITTHKQGRYLYYAGWNLGITVPFRNAIGLATAPDGQGFKKMFAGPIVDRTPTEPHFVGTCCVLNHNDAWKMWYLSCTEWRIKNDRPQHRYHIKYATSADGIAWDRKGVVSIPFDNDEEYAISRPCVLYEESLYRMWYSYRGDRYRIGYAESTDGMNWTRYDEQCGLDIEPEGWDSAMVEYPYVFRHKENLYMLYNGNGYGETGFGIAILENG